MKRILVLAGFLLLASAAASAQTTVTLTTKVCSSASGVQVCNYVPVDASNPLVTAVVPPATLGFTVVGADAVALPGGSAITMFTTGHCANGCRVSVPVAFCTNPLTVATSTAAVGGNECWVANQSIPFPPTQDAISVFSATSGTASGIGSTIP